MRCRKTMLLTVANAILLCDPAAAQEQGYPWAEVVEIESHEEGRDDLLARLARTGMNHGRGCLAERLSAHPQHVGEVTLFIQPKAGGPNQVHIRNTGRRSRGEAACFLESFKHSFTLGEGTASPFIVRIAYGGPGTTKPNGKRQPAACDDDLKRKVISFPKCPGEILARSDLLEEVQRMLDKAASRSTISRERGGSVNWSVDRIKGWQDPERPAVVWFEYQLWSQTQEDCTFSLPGCKERNQRKGQKFCYAARFARKRGGFVLELPRCIPGFVVTDVFPLNRTIKGDPGSLGVGGGVYRDKKPFVPKVVPKLPPKPKPEPKQE